MKPHELARLKRDCKQNDGNGSDIDISDLDMDNVDDLLAMTTDSNTATEIQTTSNDIAERKSAKRKNASASSTHSENINNKTKTSNQKGKPEILEDQDFDLDVELDDDTTKKQRFNSTSSDKIWPSKQTDDAYKSLLSNLETTLQSIDTLVVEPSTKTSNNGDNDRHHTQTKRKSRQESASTAQRTQQIQLSRGSGGEKETNSQTGQTRGRKSKTAAKQPKRPQMIHTEKASSEGSAIAGGLGGSKKKSKSIITRTQSTNLDILPKTSTIVDDYDIISPASHPPKQISSSPLHIKQEQDNRYNHQLHDHHQLQNQQQQQQHHFMKNSPNNNHNTSVRTQSTTRHTNANDLYDAHLLLEASGLRNDLDEILRSPLKADKLRQRFTSESSTQFLTEQSEEEQHLIKIEPTSPDLREIVNGASSVNTSAAELEVTTTTSRTRRSYKSSTRSKRTMNTNCKYIEFTSDIASSENTNNLDKRSQMNSLNTSGTKCSKSVRTEPAKALKSIQDSNAVVTASSYLDYTTMVDTFGTVTSSSTNNNNSFASISAVVSAADASAAAQQQNATANRNKPQRYFECEMCCAIFSDRAQLLDHVPIHI